MTIMFSRTSLIGGPTCCEKAGWSAGSNEPFSGSHVPLRFLGEAPVQSVITEIKRSPNMGEATGNRLRRFAEVQRFVGEILSLAFEEP